MELANLATPLDSIEVQAKSQTSVLANCQKDPNHLQQEGHLEGFPTMHQFQAKNEIASRPVSSYLKNLFGMYYSRWLVLIAPNRTMQ
jgi:hypothetical protein